MHDHANHHHAMQYVCEGECGARLTPQEYAAHPTKVCGADGCSHKGHTFTPKKWCQECQKFCREGNDK